MMTAQTVLAPNPGVPQRLRGPIQIPLETTFPSRPVAQFQNNFTKMPLKCPFSKIVKMFPLD